MRVAVVDFFASSILFKDPAQITLGLRDLGADAIYVSRGVLSAGVGDPPFPLVLDGDLHDRAFWSSLKLDAALVISRLAPDARPIIDAIRACGVRLVLKADSDGTLGYPLAPNYLRILDWRAAPVRTLLRTLKWRAPLQHFVRPKLEQIGLADAVVIESPGALANVQRVLAHWKMPALAGRVHFVPNPVAPDIIAAPVPESREALVAAVGRWDDERPKNTAAMVASLVEFLGTRDDFRAVIIGPGVPLVERLLADCPAATRTRIEVAGPVDHGRLPAYLGRARMLLMPSRMESFGIAAAEAVCCGCSVVVTPVESLAFLAGGGQSGTVAAGFGAGEIHRALVDDARKWDQGSYSPLAIAARWRAVLDRRVIASRLLELLQGGA